ncbi:MAG: carboxypeptidase-like regulatory domain-containing protein [Gemmatimonadota bacterium]
MIGPDSAAVPNATITISSRPDSTTRVTRTDAKGTFSVTVENGGSAFLVIVNMLGYAPQRRTVTPVGAEPLPSVDFKLIASVAQLGAVRTVGERPKPPRSEASAGFTPGASATIMDAMRGLGGDLTGDLSAGLALMPGITVVPSATGGLPTVSAYGQGADQNNVVLNGLGFGATPPRDGFALSALSSTYDPARGGFAGVQLSLRMNQGGNYSSRLVRGTLDAPSMQWTTPLSSRFGTQYDQRIVSGTLSGPVVMDKAFYAIAWQVNRRTSGLPTLLSMSPASLAALQISPDSVSRLLASMGAVGIPTVVTGMPSSRANNEGRIAVRFDYTPKPAAPQPGVISVQGVPNVSDDYYLQVGGSWRSNDGSGIGPTSIATTGTRQTHRDMWMQATSATYLPLGFLNEATAGFSASADRGDPYLATPTARVLLNSQLPDGTTGITSLQLAGSSAGSNASSTWNAEVRDQLTRFTWDRRHQMTLTLNSTIDHFDIDQSAGLGSFAYSSLADFLSGAPASYSRTITGRRSTGSGMTGAIGLGDIYNPTPNLRTQFGVRMEGNHLGVSPTWNPAIDSLFGRRTDHVPSTFAVMPMFGFSWLTFGTITVPGFLGANPRGSISGGIREYRGSLSTRSIDGYSRQTGLPDAIQQIACVGSATPLPAWASYAQSSGSIPVRCADGTAGSALSQGAPPVALFASDYALSRSWRPALNVNYQLLPTVNLTLGTTYALNLDQPAIYDLNLQRVQKFALADEAGRPVFVSPGSIVPTTGSLAWTESRVSSRFAHVAETRSDLRSENRQFTVSASYQPLFVPASQTFWFLSLAYAYTSAREQYYGFTGTTGGDPTIRSWGSGSAPHHVVTVGFNYSWQRFLSVRLQGRAQSGTPFTPSVSGDVNGDGYFNDRAFVFDPAVARDPSVATAMSQLIANGTPQARDCLRQQLGSIAGRNSCTGPWSFPLLNMYLSPDAYRLHLGNRGTFTVTLTNLLGGADQLLHGSDHLRGWGQYAFVDPTLLTVRGYDAAQNRFTYSVNPQFANTAVYRNTFRSPFTISLDFRVELGRDRETQYVQQAMRLSGEERVETLTVDQVRQKIAPIAFDPFLQLFQQKDSIGLSARQVDSLNALRTRYMTAKDSVKHDLSSFLAGRRGDYGGADVRARWHGAAIAVYEALFALIPAMRAVLTDEQVDRITRNPRWNAGFVVQEIPRAQLEVFKRSAVPLIPF